MKIASWNVNSLNVRLPHLLEWLKIGNPDVLVLQETKLEDHKFPQAEIEAAGELLEWRNGCGDLVARLLAYCGWSRAEVLAEWDRLFAGPGPEYVLDPEACARCRRKFTSRLKRSATVPALCKACRGVVP